jgi:hypothetical protein
MAEKPEQTVHGKLTWSLFTRLERWLRCTRRKKCEAVSMVMERVLELYEQQGVEDQPLEQFVRRLQLGPA